MIMLTANPETCRGGPHHAWNMAHAHLMAVERPLAIGWILYVITMYQTLPNVASIGRQHPTFPYGGTTWVPGRLALPASTSAHTAYKD